MDQVPPAPVIEQLHGIRGIPELEGVFSRTVHAYAEPLDSGLGQHVANAVGEVAGVRPRHEIGQHGTGPPAAPFREFPERHPLLVPERLVGAQLPEGGNRRRFQIGSVEGKLSGHSFALRAGGLVSPARFRSTDCS